MLDYIVHQLEIMWDILSFIIPFEDGYTDFILGSSFFKSASIFTLIVAYSIISLALDYFNSYHQEDDK